MAYLLRFFRLVFWWLIIIACIGLIGFFLWPLFSEKSAQLSSGQWDGESRIDRLQSGLEGKTNSFIEIGSTATSDVLTDPSGKIKVQYIQGNDGVYRPVKN